MTDTSGLIDECAKIGHQHCMAILDELYPESAGKVTWDNENEACKQEWRERAGLMLIPCMKNEVKLRVIIKNIIDELDYDPSNWLLIRDEIKTKLALIESQNE